MGGFSRSARWAVVPRWAVISSATAPVLLVGGWTVAAARQRPGFDPVRESISALAAVDADSRWMMTAALAGVGVCHLVTATGLRPAATPGRVLLGVGGAGTLAVSAFPLPADHARSAAHAVAAAVAFGALGAWPAFSADGRGWPAFRAGGRGWTGERGRGVSWGLRRPVALGAAATLLGLIGWFVSQLGGGSLLGLTERLAAGAQALWPFVVVMTCMNRPGAASAGTAQGRSAVD